MISDSAGDPLEGDKTPVNTYTREMWDIDDAILEARFNDKVSVIIVTGHGEKFFSAEPVSHLNTLSPRYNISCLVWSYRDWSKH